MPEAIWKETDYDYRVELSDEDLGIDGFEAIDLSSIREPDGDTSFSNAKNIFDKLMQQAHHGYYRGKVEGALKIYQRASTYLSLYVTINSVELHPSDERKWLTLNIEHKTAILKGDCYRRIGSNTNALREYTSAGRYLGAEPILSRAMLFTRAATAALDEGDVWYRRENQDRAIQQYAKVFDRDSELYTGSLVSLHDNVQRVRDALVSESKLPDYGDLTPLLTDIAARAHGQLLQIEAGEDFFGYRDGQIPLIRFEHLKDLAKRFAVAASRANREYLNFQSSAEAQTHTTESLRQMLEVESAGYQVEIANEESAIADIRSAVASVNTAESNLELARNSEQKYRDIGWEIVQLDALSAWASSAQGNPKTRLAATGYEHLGLQGGYIDPEDRIHELALKRSQRSYSLRRAELSNQVQARRNEVLQANTQLRASKARRRVSNARGSAAEARLDAAQASYDRVRENTVNAKVYYELASEMRDSAKIYLNRAVHIASLMERAYEVESGHNVNHIRHDYGDLTSTSGLLAADLLMKDIDYFDYHRVVSAKQKQQQAVRVVSLAREFPLEMQLLREQGKSEFALTLKDMQDRHPGIFNVRVKKVLVEFAGSFEDNRPPGTLKCGASSTARLYNSSTGQFYEKIRPHGVESLVLTDFRLAQSSFVHPPQRDEIAVFEGVGLDVSWSLELNRQFIGRSVRGLTDVMVFIHYECQHDSELEQSDAAARPIEGRSVYQFGLKDRFSKRLISTISQGSEGEFQLVPSMFPAGMTSPRIRKLQLFVAGDTESVDLLAHLSLGGHAAQNIPVEKNGVVLARKPAGTAYFEGLSPIQGWSVKISSSNGSDLPDEWLVDIVLVLELDYDLLF